MLKSQLIEEPNLFFGLNNKCIDPKVGLLNYGPNGPYGTGEMEPIQILIGVISTRESLSSLRNWLDGLKRRIGGKKVEDSDIRGIDFPGINRDERLCFELKIDESNIEYIDYSEIEKLGLISNRKQRIIKALKLYEQAFSDISSANPPCKLVLLPISDKLMELCRDPRYIQDKIVLEHRSFDDEDIDESIFDFHSALKVISFKYQRICQLIKPSTLRLTMEQDVATTAWNFAVATYYKGTGVPWKLADIDEGTCYVGISFYQEIHKNYRAMRSSMAHVYLRTGESQVIRSKTPFLWDESRGRSPQLSVDQARGILDDVISLYKRQKNKLPDRIVVHKTSPYTEEEIEGFNKATQGIELVDFIHIYNNVTARFYVEKHDYPPIRGTLIYSDENKEDAFLYTTGYIPSLGTYPGSSIPNPLRIKPYKLGTNIQQVAKDIMSLSKLDWNSADFCKRLPVTISALRRVGKVLSEMRAYDIKEPPSDYRYYM